jgi:uncharacterized RDD family membrane protein YckC
LLFSRSRYHDPTGNYVAGFAMPWRRAVAATLDWGLCYVAFLLVSIPLGAIQGLGNVSWEEGDFGGLPGHIVVVVSQVLTVVPAIAYFGFYLPTSQTPGMGMLVDVRAVSMRTGRAPSRTMAIVRGIVATAIAASFYLTYLSATSFNGPRHLNTATSHALTLAHVGFVVGAVSALIMIVTPTHRSLVDRLFGTAVLDDLEAVAPRMGPWGPLDEFDLSRRQSTAPPVA